MLEKAIFGAGCFWGVEARFAAAPGVLDAVSGYAGGTLEQPTYKDVCAGRSGHAEVVEVTYRPERISFSQLLDLFFAMHNPTQPYLNAGQKDRSQYRSVVYATSEAQAAEARARIAALDASGAYATPVATQVELLPRFWRAEESHQRYYEKRNVSVGEPGAACAVSPGPGPDDGPAGKLQTPAAAL